MMVSKPALSKFRISRILLLTVTTFKVSKHIQIPTQSIKAFPAQAAAGVQGPCRPSIRA